MHNYVLAGDLHSSLKNTSRFGVRSLNQQLLAKQLRLSRTTVSRSLSNHPAISAETRTRVQTLAAQLGYRSAPTRAIRKPRQAKPITFGVLIGTPLAATDLVTFPTILQGIRQRAAIDHVAIDVVCMNPTELTTEVGQRRIFRQIRAAGWRGVILIYPFAAETVRMLARKLCVVSVLTEYADVNIDVIDTDHGNVSWLVRELAQRGHRRIGFVSWHYPVGGLWAPRRYAAFAEGLAMQGLELNPAWVFNIHTARPSLTTPEALADAVAHATRHEGVTAWICAADHQAYQLVSDLRARGIRVPQDCSITGFDGNEPPPGLPQVATLTVPNEDIGASAVARLGSRLLNSTSPLCKILVETAFVPGATLAPPPAPAP